MTFLQQVIILHFDKIKYVYKTYRYTVLTILIYISARIFNLCVFRGKLISPQKGLICLISYFQ